MKKFIPPFLKKPLLTLYVFARLVLRGPAGNGLRLNLAGVLPAPGRLIHGGKVKLIHLREKFGDSWQGFNLAYFVSSGLPFAPEIWMRLYRKFGVKIVWNQNGVAYPALYPQEVVERVNNLMRPIHESDFVVYQTEFTKRCADKYLEAFKGPSAVLINPVDTGTFAPRKTALPDEPFIILMMGNHFESEERWNASLEPLRQLRGKGVNLKLIVLGKTDKKFTEDWIEAKGPYLQAEAPALFREAHCFLHLKYLDPCPTAVLEAMASGMPVIGSRTGGMPELVSDASGVLLPLPEDFNALHYPAPETVAEAILRVKKELPKFSQAAREQALRFDKEIWLKKHEEIFNSLLK